MSWPKRLKKQLSTLTMPCRSNSAPMPSSVNSRMAWGNSVMPTPISFTAATRSNTVQAIPRWARLSASASPVMPPPAMAIRMRRSARALRDVEAALDRRPRQAALQPGRDVLQRVPLDQFAGAIEAVDGAHPAEHRNVGDGVFVAHDPLAARQPLVEHVEHALRFVDEALQRPLILDVLAGEFVEKADLAEDRPDPRHLEEYPFHGLVALRRVFRHQLAGLFGEIDQDRAGLEKADGLAARTVGIDDRRNLAVGVQRLELRREGLVFHDVDAVRRRKRIKLQAVRVLGRPALGNRKSGQIGHRRLLISRSVVPLHPVGKG